MSALIGRKLIEKKNPLQDLESESQIWRQMILGTYFLKINSGLVWTVLFTGEKPFFFEKMPIPLTDH